MSLTRQHVVVCSRVIVGAVIVVAVAVVAVAVSAAIVRAIQSHLLSTLSCLLSLLHSTLLRTWI